MERSTRSALALSDVVLSYQMVAGATAPETVEAAAAAGFGSVTIRVVPNSGTIDAAVIAEMAAVPETLAALSAAGVSVTDVEIVLLTPDWQIDHARPVIEAGAALGARCTNVMCIDPDETRTIENFGLLCELVAGYDMRASLEFMAFSEIETVEQAYRVVTAVNHPAGTIAVDVLHVARSAGTVDAVAELAELDPSIFGGLHLCDGRREPVDGSEEGLFAEALSGRLLPGEGDLPVFELMQALPEATIYMESPTETLADQPFATRAAAAAAALRSSSDGLIV